MKSVKFVFLFLYFMTMVGCFLDRSGRLIINSCEGVEIKVLPKFICQGESVEVSWEVEPLTTRSCPSCRSSIGEVSIEITTTLPGSTMITSSAATGSQIISIPLGFSRGFSIVVNVKRNGYSGENQENRIHQCIKSEDIWVLPQDASRNYIDSLTWCCFCIDGASGYPVFTFGLGEITSQDVEVTSLRNPNDFAIFLSTNGRTDRMGLPDDVAPILIPPGATITTFNGQLNGTWIAVTDPPPPSVECPGSPGDPVVNPDPNAPVIVISPNIVLEWLLTCNMN